MSPRRIVITGASRGVGAALSAGYAAPGVSLCLVGRDAARLESVAETCRAQGAAAQVAVADVRDRAAMADLLARFDAAGPVDLVIANAGVALPTGGSPGDDASVYGEVETNLVGTLNTALPLLPAMAQRGHGQVALVSSLAAFAPLPSSPGYSATKAAVLVYGQALRERLRPIGVRISVVCPGFIETDMAARYQGWKPFMMSASEAARRIRAGLAADHGVIAFPRRLAWLARAGGAVPEAVRRIGLKAFRFQVGRSG